MQVVADRKASPRNDPSSKRPSLSISPLKNKNDNVSSKLVEKSSRNSARSLSDETIPSHLVKVPLNSKSWSDQRISWDALPLTIKDLGKVQSKQNLKNFNKLSATISPYVLNAFRKLCLIGMFPFWLLYKHWKKRLVQRPSLIAYSMFPVFTVTITTVAWH